MRSDYLQDVRYKLQKRVRRLNGATWENFLFLLRQFWVFLDTSPILHGTVEQLLASYPNWEQDAKQIFAGKHVAGDNETESAGIAYGVLRLYAKQEDPRIVSRFLPLTRPDKFDDMVERFRSVYLEPFYEYIDEHLDDPRFVLNVLLRFKRTCEWFRRKELYALWEADTRTGEKRLALKLYEYLYEEGVEFSVEPWSASGEADLVASQQSNEPLIADAKVFNPEKGKSKRYLLQGFRQIYQYTSDYNEPIGYLVIFNTSDSQLRFAVGASAEPLPRIVLNNKTIFFLVIDIYPHSLSASKRPQPEIVEMSEGEIVGSATAPQANAE